MTFTPRGIIAVDKQGDRILFLDPQSLAVTGALENMPTLPHELAISPDRRRAYVPAYGDGAHGDNPHPNHLISVIDLDARRREADIDLAPLEAPHTMRFGPDGALYVACENSAAIAVVDVAAGRVADRIGTGSHNSHRLTILPRRGLICTDNEEDASVTLLSLAERARVGSVPLPSAIAGIAASMDETRLYCTDAAQPRLWTIALDEARPDETVVEAPIALAGHRKGSQVVRACPDGRAILVIGDHEPIVTLIDAQTGEQRSVQVGEKPMDGAFHPDGRTFLLANESSGTLTEIDLATATVRRTVAVGTGCETLAYF